MLHPLSDHRLTMLWHNPFRVIKFWQFGTHPATILVLPYGIADAAIGIATVPLSELLAALGG
jgi:hypothetical protein